MRQGEKNERKMSEAEKEKGRRYKREWEERIDAKKELWKKDKKRRQWIRNKSRTIRRKIEKKETQGRGIRKGIIWKRKKKKKDGKKKL